MPDEVLGLLADYATQADGGLTPTVKKDTVRRLIDSVGVALGAFPYDATRAARQHARDLPVPGGNLVWGTDLRTSVERAALTNGLAVRYLDYNDSFFSNSGSHPSDVIAGLVAAAEQRDLSSDELLEGIAVAYEVILALCDTFIPRLQGWDHINLTGLGGCCGIARILGLTPEQTRHAIAIATVSHAASNQTRLGSLSMWKAFAAPDAVRHALYCCELAAAGVQGPDEPFVGKAGFVQLISGGEMRDAQGLEPLRALAGPTRISDTHLKAWPLGYVAQSGVQAGLQIHEQLSAPADVAKIEIAVYESAIPMMADSPDKWAPKTRETADHSLPYSVASAILDGYVDERTFRAGAYDDPERHAFLQERVTVVADDALTERYPRSHPTRVRVETTFGDVLTAEIDFPEGHARNPMSDEVLEQKFTRLAEPLLGPGAADAYATLAQMETTDVPVADALHALVP